MCDGNCKCKQGAGNLNNDFVEISKDVAGVLHTEFSVYAIDEQNQKCLVDNIDRFKKFTTFVVDKRIVNPILEKCIFDAFIDPKSGRKSTVLNRRSRDIKDISFYDLRKILKRVEDLDTAFNVGNPIDDEPITLSIFEKLDIYEKDEGLSAYDTFLHILNEYINK